MPMKVHPAPRKRNIAAQRAVVVDSSSSTPNAKKLRRLPHVFAKVLELPFHSDADVSVQETPESFCFTVAATEDIMSVDVRAHAVEIFPGLTKVVIIGLDGADSCDCHHELDEVEYLWRFRLPASTRPEMASATCSGGALIVTVPKEAISGKIDHQDNEEEEEDGDDDYRDDHDIDGIWSEEKSIERMIIIE